MIGFMPCWGSIGTMKYNLFDLTGREQYCCAQESSEKDIAVPDPQPLRPLLIIPKETSNKSPYLQNPENPHIEDFITPEGDFNYDNSVFLSDILADKLDKKKSVFLEDYFRAQLNCLNGFDKTNESIILVPDHYDAEKQERILRACQMSRNKTFLLWRSIAICLGAEDYFQTGLLHDGDKIAVIDGQSSGLVICSILTMKEIVRDGSTWLIPARHAYRKNEYYSLEHGPYTNDSDMSTSSSAFDFWCHTWQNDGEYLVPDNGEWYMESFQNPTYECSLSYSRLLREVDLIVVSGKVRIKGYPSYIPLVKEKESENFAILGAGRFAVRKNNGLPTYFDECESLFFIAQAPNRETNRVFAQELIENNEFCEGGSRIEGKIDKSFTLPKGTDSIRFLLHVGDITPRTQLKVLEQKFPKTTTVDQPLTLHPSMIPGQGIAKVRVEARPLLFSDIELDFLRMEDATYKDIIWGEQPETMQHLEESMPLSFPIDLPGVRASRALWPNNSVDLYINCDYLSNNGLFAKSRFPNINSHDTTRFERVNVFGNIEGYQFPIQDMDKIHRLFVKIQEDYENGYIDNSVRLAAWTYRCGIDVFQPMVDRTLEKVQRKANGERVSVSKQEFTLCANMLSNDENTVFFNSFNRYANRYAYHVGRSLLLDTRIQPYNWLRALQGILMYSNDFLRDIDNETCLECMSYLFLIFCKMSSSPSISKKALYCMLFLLRRRKYDQNFLREGDPLYEEITNGLNQFDSFELIVLKFIEAKGTLDDLASLIEDADNGN